MLRNMNHTHSSLSYILPHPIKHILEEKTHFCKLEKHILYEKNTHFLDEKNALLEKRENKISLCSKAINLNIRLRIFEALISSIFLYNSEIWTLNYSDKRKIDTFQRSFLRQIVRRKWIKNKHLYKKCNTKPGQRKSNSGDLNGLGTC